MNSESWDILTAALAVTTLIVLGIWLLLPVPPREKR